MAQRIDTLSAFATPVPIAQIRANMLNEEQIAELDQLPKDVIKNALPISRQKGNEHFKNKEYVEAEGMYTVAIASTAYLKDTEGLRTLMSNRSACRGAQKQWHEALKDAEVTVALDPNFSKGWFRKGRALYALGNLDAANHAFGEGLRIGSEAEKKDFTKWRGKIAAEKERRIKEKERKEKMKEQKKTENLKKEKEKELKKKNLQRSSIDYSKFDTVLRMADRLAEEEDPSEGGGKQKQRPTLKEGYTEEEFQKALDFEQEQRKMALSLLECTTFTNSMIFEEFDVEKLKVKFSSQPDAIPSVVRRVMTVGALELPNKLVAAIEDPSLHIYNNALQSILQSADTDGHCLFLGIGTALPCIMAAKSQHWKKGITIIPVYHSPMLDNLYTNIFAVNGVKVNEYRPNSEELADESNTKVHIVKGKPLESLTFNIKRFSAEDIKGTRIPPYADVVVLDPDLFDAGLLGHRVLPMMHHVRREMCTRRTKVFPPRVRVFCQPCSFSYPDVSGFAVDKVISDYLWAPIYEALDSNLDRGAKAIEGMAEPLPIFDFDFEAPDVAQGLPMDRSKKNQFHLTKTGKVNAIVFWFEVDLSNGESLNSKASLNSMWKQAVQFVDWVNVKAGDKLQVIAIQSPTRLKFKIDAKNHQLPVGSNLVGPKVYQNSLQRWQFDVDMDPVRNHAYELAIDKAVMAKRAEKANRVNVLEFGCGAGFKSLYAARSGASSVTGIGALKNLVQVARDVAKENKLSAKVSFIQNDILKVCTGKGEEIKQKQDVLIIDIVDYGLIGDGILHYCHHAWSHCLKSDAIVVPAAGKVYAMLVQLGKRDIEGINMTPWGSYRYTEGYNGIDLTTTSYAPLTEPFEVFGFDFSKKGTKNINPKTVCTWRGSLPIVNCGVFNAVVWWHDLVLYEDIILSSSPFKPKTSMMQACQMMEELTLEKGQQFGMEASHQGSLIQFKVDISKFNGKGYMSLRTDVLLWDPFICKMKELIKKSDGNWAEALSNPKTKQPALEAILEVCKEAGRFSFGGKHIDPQVALVVMRSMFAMNSENL